LPKKRQEPRQGVYVRMPYSLAVWFDEYALEIGEFKNDLMVRALIEYKARIEAEKKKKEEQPKSQPPPKKEKSTPRK